MSIPFSKFLLFWHSIIPWAILHFPVNPKGNWWIKILVWWWQSIVSAFFVVLMGKRVFLIKVSDNLMLWIAIFHFQNRQTIFWLLNNSNGPKNRVINRVQYDQFSDEDGDSIIKGEVFIIWITIFKKKRKKLFLYLLVNVQMAFFTCFLIHNCCHSY